MNCPFNGECLLKGVYKTKVRDKEYIGSTESHLRNGGTVAATQA